MLELEKAVLDIITAEVDELTLNELAARLQRNTSGTGYRVAVPASGCRFCLPQYSEVRHETETDFVCDLKACVTRSLASHMLGILQDADLKVDVTNDETAHNRLTSVLQAIFSEQKAKEIATRSMATLKEAQETRLDIT